MVNLKCYKNKLYELARKWSVCRNCLLWIEFFLLILLVFLDDYHIITYVTLGVIVLIHISTEYLKYRIKRANMLAFKFDKLRILRIAYNYLPSNFEIADLKSESIFFNLNLRACLNMKNEFEEDDYNIIDNSTPEKKLLSILQENAFWNHHQYQYMYLKKRKFISIIFSIIFLILFAYIGTLLFVDNTYSIKILFADHPINIILVFLSFGVLYEIIDEMYNYKKASMEMNELDNEITRIYDKDNLTNSAMSLIVKYHYIKAMCPYIDNDIYKNYGKSLNIAWDLRVNQHLKESIKKISNELKDIKHKWAITGGANLYLKGCKEKTYDIDIITTKDGFIEIAKTLNIEIPKILKKTESFDKNLKSYYALAKIDGKSVDIMGDPKSKIDGQWQPLNWHNKVVEQNIDNIIINTTTLEYEKYTQSIIHQQKIYNLEQKCEGDSKNAE